MIKVLIVDDQLIFRKSLEFIIGQDSEIEAVSCAGEGREAFDLCKRLQPDIVLMDVMMPDCEGIEGVKLIKARYENLKVIILTAFVDEENIAKALRCGTDGYVLKDISPNDLVLAIKSIARGLNIIHENVFEIVKKRFNYDDIGIGQVNNIANSELTT